MPSGAKARKLLMNYGKAEAVPFQNRVLTHPLKPWWHSLFVLNSGYRTSASNTPVSTVLACFI